MDAPRNALSLVPRAIVPLGNDFVALSGPMDSLELTRFTATGAVVNEVARKPLGSS